MNDWNTQAFGRITDLIREHARAEPQRRAVVDGTREIDYRTLDALMDRVAAALQRDGCQVGDSIAICAGSSIEYVALFLGALRAGVVVAPLAPSATADSLARMQADADATILFIDASTADSVGTAAPGAIPRIALDDSGVGRAFGEWLAPVGTQPAPADVQPAPCVQHHLFVGHHRRAQRHRAVARDALGPRGARRDVRLRRRTR